MRDVGIAEIGKKIVSEISYKWDGEVIDANWWSSTAIMKRVHELMVGEIDWTSTTDASGLRERT